MRAAVNTDKGGKITHLRGELGKIEQ